MFLLPLLLLLPLLRVLVVVLINERALSPSHKKLDELTLKGFIASFKTAAASVVAAAASGTAAAAAEAATMATY